MRNHTVWRLWAVLLGVFLSACGGLNPTPARLQSTPSDDEVNAIAREMYCPICENVPLDVCDTAACADWRQLIRQKLTQGWSEPQIQDYFVQQYGDRVLAEPPRRGFNWLVYVIPPLLFVTAGFFLVRLLMKMRRPVSAAPVSPPPDPSGDAYVQRLEEELKKRDL
jgi:cytochrome c-type biogenesis protein CcmH